MVDAGGTISYDVIVHNIVQLWVNVPLYKQIIGYKR